MWVRLPLLSATQLKPDQPPDSQTPAEDRRDLPAVDRLLRLDGGDALASCYGRQTVVDELRRILELHRALIASASRTTPMRTPPPSPAQIVEQSADNLRALWRPSLRPVFNLTGTVLHTNLGRALMLADAVAAAAAAMARLVNLEYDIDEGGRDERDAHVAHWLTRLTGAARAVVVNNNAAAVHLILNRLALRKEVVVSRGELVEIGGSLRIPDLMARAGSKPRDVGITNRTMKRALRLDKGRLAALESVLRRYADPSRLAERLPTLLLGHFRDDALLFDLRCLDGESDEDAFDSQLSELRLVA